ARMRSTHPDCPGRTRRNRRVAPCSVAAAEVASERRAHPARRTSPTNLSVERWHNVAMGFFERNRSALVEQGIDPARLPPGQYSTDRFPVLHVGDVPTYQPNEWTLTIFGLVDNPFTLSLDELRALPAVTRTFDIHCVTKWSKFDTQWTGVPVRDLFER